MNSASMYKGYKEVFPSDVELATFYENPSNNCFGCLINEYVLIKDIAGKVVDVCKWNGNNYISVQRVKFKSRMLDVIKPLDEIQTCAFDSIKNNDITLLYGRAGSGKTTIPMGYIMQEVDNHRIEKVHIIYHFEPLRGARTLGFEKGDHNTKLLNTGSISGILDSKLGDYDYARNLGVAINIIPTANIRGVEFGEKDCVFVTECQNINPYTLKTIIQRCKAGCKQIYEGDLLEQSDIDMKISGMQRMIDVFSGHRLFGCVKLKNNYRSELCELADKMTEY